MDLIMLRNKPIGTLFRTKNNSIVMKVQHKPRYVYSNIMLVVRSNGNFPESDCLVSYTDDGRFSEAEILEVDIAEELGNIREFEIRNKDNVYFPCCS
mgnify:FL=1